MKCWLKVAGQVWMIQILVVAGLVGRELLRERKFQRNAAGVVSGAEQLLRAIGSEH